MIFCLMDGGDLVRLRPRNRLNVDFLALLAHRAAAAGRLVNRTRNYPPLMVMCLGLGVYLASVPNPQD